MKRGSKETAGFLRKRGITEARKGQLQLSFGMIFSIIIIIATISIAFYFIQKILAAQECTKIELFKSDLQDTIDKVWRSPFGSESFSSTIPSGVKKVCIGNPSLASAQYKSILEEADSYLDEGENFIILPIKEACKGNLATAELKHIKDSFTCFDSAKGRISFTIYKGNSTDTLVSLKK